MANTKQHTYSYEQRVRNLEKSREILATLRGGEPSEMTFELWLNGQPLDPNDYISFSTQKQETSQPKAKKYEAEPAEQPVKKVRRDSTQVRDTSARVKPKKVEQSEVPAESKPAESATPAPAPAPAPAVETPAPVAE